jgi:CheY-like chemotaxis protein
MGMDQETQAHIFEPFFSTKRHRGGTGLGLASVHGAVCNQGGAIRVRSECGKGSTFEVFLPAGPDEGRVDAAPEPVVVRDSQQATVLVIDDEPLVRTSIQRQLQEHGYGVIACEDGWSAVQRLREELEGVDVVLFDLMMPGWSAVQTFDEIRRVAPDVPVVLMSGYSVEGEAQSLLDRGAHAFLQKPFSAFQLQSVVDGAAATVAATPGLAAHRDDRLGS